VFDVAQLRIYAVLVAELGVLVRAPDCHEALRADPLLSTYFSRILEVGVVLCGGHKRCDAR
jgi:hypothetical protein